MLVSLAKFLWKRANRSIVILGVHEDVRVRPDAARVELVLRKKLLGKVLIAGLKVAADEVQWEELLSVSRSKQTRLRKEWKMA